ncbi:MAG: helix-turn-helix transcriptional regulator [Sphaerochaeta sp.]|nr:helix-turn-helix transcriptional regulator [Sphaerochaeta sp.]
MQDTDESVGKKLVFLRKKLNLSKSAFAQKIGYSVVHLYRIETGEGMPTQEMIDTIVKVFHLDPRWPSPEVGKNPFLDAPSDVEDLSGPAGNRLVQWRKENGILQKDLAARTGISLANLVEVEFGRRKMSARFAKKIEDACDVSASWLLYGDEQSKENPCGDKMIEFLRKTPEARKIVWEMMEREND